MRRSWIVGVALAGAIFAVGCGDGTACPSPGSVQVDGPATAKVGDTVEMNVTYAASTSCLPPDAGGLHLAMQVTAPDGGDVYTSTASQTLSTDADLTYTGTVTFPVDVAGTYQVDGELFPEGATETPDAGIDGFHRTVEVTP